MLVSKSYFYKYFLCNSLFNNYFICTLLNIHLLDAIDMVWRLFLSSAATSPLVPEKTLREYVLLSLSFVILICSFFI